MGTRIRVTHTAAASPLDLVERLRRLLHYRDLLRNLVRKELRVRYKDSALGFLWSMLNPILYLVVFYVVFGLFLTGGIPRFPVFLLAGLLPWTLFSSSLAAATGSVVGGGALLKKVYFPREVLPIASIGAALFHFFLQMLVLIGVLVVFRQPFGGRDLVLVPIALAVEIVLLLGLGLLMASLNVYLRDIQHFLDLALLAWFWMTPVVYPIVLVFNRLQPKGLFGLFLVNPMTPVVLAFQKAFYQTAAPLDRAGNPVQTLLDQPLSWYVDHLLYVGLVGVVLVLAGLIVFGRLEGNFAEEL